MLPTSSFMYIGELMDRDVHDFESLSNAQRAIESICKAAIGRTIAEIFLLNDWSLDNLRIMARRC